VKDETSKEQDFESLLNKFLEKKKKEDTTIYEVEVVIDGFTIKHVEHDSESAEGEELQ
jgi:hypothetical protein